MVIAVVAAVVVDLDYFYLIQAIFFRLMHPMSLTCFRFRGREWMGVGCVSRVASVYICVRETNRI